MRRGHLLARRPPQRPEDTLCAATSTGGSGCGSGTLEPLDLLAHNTPLSFFAAVVKSGGYGPDTELWKVIE